MRRLALVLAFGAAAAASAPASASAQTQLDFPSERHGVKVSADRGAVAWSRQVSSNRFRLVIRERGRTRLARVRSRSVPFDVDLGPGPDGRTVAVYSRCGGEPKPIGFPNLPAWAGGRRCSIHMYDLRSRRERRLRVSRRGATDYVPSIWGKRVAFARRTKSRAGGLGEARIIVAPVNGRGKPRVLRGGPSSKERKFPGIVGSLDFAGRRLAYVWTAGGEGQLRLATLGGVRRVIEEDSGERESSGFLSPVIDGGHIYWAGTVARPAGGDSFFARYSIRTGQVTRADAPLVSSFARDRGSVFYSGFDFNPPGVVMAPEPDFR